MPQRQQMPFNWGNQRSQMGPYQRPMYHPSMMNRQMGSMGSMRQMRQVGHMGFSQNRSGGGLLSKLLGRSNPSMGGGVPGLFSSTGSGGATASGGSFLKNLANPTAISGFLNNTQQVLSAFQQITPLVSQYGPIIKNIPTMWKLYRGLKDATEETNSEQTEMESVELEEESVEKEEVLTTERNRFSTDEEPTRSKEQTKNQNHHSIKVKINDESTESDEDDWDKPEEQPRVHHFQERRSFPRIYI